MKLSRVEEVTYFDDGTATIWVTREDLPGRLGALTVLDPPPGMEAMEGVHLESRGRKIYVAGKHFADKLRRSTIRLVPKPRAACVA